MDDLTIINASKNLSDQNSCLQEETFWISQLRYLAALEFNIDEYLFLCMGSLFINYIVFSPPCHSFTLPYDFAQATFFVVVAVH